mmetsp:Transcript_19694/g.24283  ORF Transcript_19694/g.24283 Transcript_19694/m.24283 type:complete len:115 (-) Transcript_19694:1443-1787(-)
MQYINWFEFLVKELECRIELSHLMSIVEWFMAFNEKQGVGLASSHEIFKDRSLTSTEIVELDESVMPLNESARRDSVRPRKFVRFSHSLLEEEKGEAVEGYDPIAAENSQEEEK